MAEASLKYLTARSVKWNAVDRLSSQVLYAVTGIVLANVLTPADFGLVGAVLIFQAFGGIMVDSGFSFALIQRKDPDRLDYSSVLWFNLIISALAYLAFYILAPWIADWFEDSRLTSLSRVMFLSMVINATAMVQINRHIKMMDVRPVAIANIMSLTTGGCVGIALALLGAGAWAIVWQTITAAVVKSVWLWCTGHWMPVMRISLTRLRSYFGVGSSMMATSFLNTVFLNVYSFFIGVKSGLVSLGYYTQSDKWSKMGVTSITQTLTSAFVPALSQAQDDMPRFRHISGKMHRTTAYAVFPLMTGLVVMAAPIFHTLFGQKWDESILLFQLLIFRGVFTIFTGLYNNYILALGRSRLIVAMEVVRDATALVALLATLHYLSPEYGIEGVRILIYGQIAASVVAWAATLGTVCKVTGLRWWKLVGESVPYMVMSVAIGAAVWLLNLTDWPAVALLAVEAVVAGGTYLCVNKALRSRVQADALAFLLGKMKKNG